MATGLVLSIWRTFRYSRMASRYCSLLKYRSPRSRWRAFLASGDREHPATMRSAVSERTTDVRMILNISIPLLSIEKVFSEHRVTVWTRASRSPARALGDDTGAGRADECTAIEPSPRRAGKLKIECRDRPSATPRVIDPNERAPHRSARHFSDSKGELTLKNEGGRPSNRPAPGCSNQKLVLVVWAPEGAYTTAVRRRLNNRFPSSPPTPTKPVPKSLRVPGSGTDVATVRD